MISLRISATVFPINDFSERPNKEEATWAKGPDGSQK